ncbi:MAG TPA: hypothetical protein VK175_14550 [Leadbetterella sp.]|nr:hypothetical protein [Leadbetterella sp.]
MIFIGSFFSFLLFANSIFANEIRIVFDQNSSSAIVVKLRKDNLVLDSAKFDSNEGKDLLLVSNFDGIHVASFDSKFQIFLYLKKSQDLEVKVDIDNGKLEVIDSFESQQLNTIFENWEREVAILKTLKEPTFEHFDRAFDSLASEILATQNPEIIDWASIFLVDLEKEPSKYMLSLEKFIDFEQLVRDKYPSFKFSKMKANFGVRKDNQSGYYWKY